MVPTAHLKALWSDFFGDLNWFKSKQIFTTVRSQGIFYCIHFLFCILLGSTFQQQTSQKSSITSSTSNSTQVKSILKQSSQQQQPALPVHGEEIKQETLKSTIQSAITDIEQNLDQSDYGDKENMAPQQQMLQQQQEELARQEEQRLLQEQQQQQILMQPYEQEMLMKQMQAMVSERFCDV